jgi:hypothetical protein
MDPRSRFAATFGAPRALIGMLHLGALPGTPRAREGVEAIVARAVAEARVYRDAGYDGLLLENMHDRPYLRGGVGPEVVAAMAVAAHEVRRATALPLGVQVLAAANREALAVALAAGAQFVRVEGFVFAHVADEGWVEGCAGELLRHRRALGADAVAVYADIKKKHSAHAVTADVSLAETARAAEFALADGVIVTGAATGEPASPGEVAEVAASTGLPVLVGSGLTPANLAAFTEAHGCIVGSSVKHGGHWAHPLDAEAVAAVAAAFRARPAARA